MGWTEIGSCEACKARELSAGPGAIKLPVEALSPPAMDDTCADTLGSLAAVGVAEIWLIREDTIGRIEDGNWRSCELKELSAGPTETRTAVGVLTPATMAETIEETLGSEVADGVAEI